MDGKYGKWNWFISWLAQINSYYSSSHSSPLWSYEKFFHEGNVCVCHLFPFGRHTVSPTLNILKPGIWRIQKAYATGGMSPEKLYHHTLHVSFEWKYLDKLLWFVKSEIVDINGNLCINYFSGRRPLEFGQIYASWNIGLTWFNHCDWKIHRLLLKKWGKTLELDGASVSGLSLFPYPKREAKIWTLF